MPITDTTMDDQQSFNLIRQGGKMREQGVAALYRKYAEHLCNFLISHTWKKYGRALDTDDAVEIVQDTFIKVIERCDSYKGDSTFKTWLFSIALHGMIDRYRRNKVRKTDNIGEEGFVALEQLSEAESPQVYEALRTFDPLPSSESLEDCVDRGFAEFSKNFSERAHVLSLVMEGFDTAHIAATIQRTPGATREFISQSRKRIEEFLLPCRDYLSAAS